MKKTFYIVSIALGLVSCKGQDPVVDTIPDDGDTSPRSIELRSNISIADTKAPIDQWATQDLYFFGFERSPYNAAYPTDLSQPFIDGIKTKAPSSGAIGKIELVNPADNMPFFYGYNGSAYKAYDFAACHFADAVKTVSFSKSASEVSIPYTIDGSQDIMVADTDRAEDIREAGYDPENSQAINYFPIAYAYSGYSDRSDIKPMMNFHHCLTRFDFKVQKRVESGDVQMRIDALEVDTYPSGTLVVASNNASRPAGVYPDRSGNPSMLSVSLVKDGTIYQTSKDVGSIMVSPLQQHTIKVTYSQKVSANEYKSITTTHVITPDMVDADPKPTAFLIGYRYDVTLVVRDQRPIEIFVKLLEWKNGGTVTIDPEEDNPFNE